MSVPHYRGKSLFQSHRTSRKCRGRNPYLLRQTYQTSAIAQQEAVERHSWKHRRSLPDVWMSGAGSWEAKTHKNFYKNVRWLRERIYALWCIMQLKLNTFHHFKLHRGRCIMSNVYSQRKKNATITYYILGMQISSSFLNRGSAVLKIDYRLIIKNLWNTLDVFPL